MPTSGLYYKCFTIVIYDHNDNGLYYKTALVTNLALAMIINYDPRILIYYPGILIYNPRILIYDPRIVIYDLMIVIYDHKVRY